MFAMWPQNTSTVLALVQTQMTAGTSKAKASQLQGEHEPKRDPPVKGHDNFPAKKPLKRMSVTCDMTLLHHPINRQNTQQTQHLYAILPSLWMGPWKGQISTLGRLSLRFHSAALWHSCNTYGGSRCSYERQNAIIAVLSDVPCTRNSPPLPPSN
eukprot:424802-Amphidinium_carterae.1